MEWNGIQRCFAGGDLSLCDVLLWFLWLSAACCEMYIKLDALKFMR
jgi:hypothetical protein